MAEPGRYRQRLAHCTEDNENSIEVMLGILLGRPQLEPGRTPVVIWAIAKATHIEAVLTAGEVHYIAKAVNLAGFLGVLGELLGDMDTHQGSGWMSIDSER